MWKTVTERQTFQISCKASQKVIRWMLMTRHCWQSKSIAKSILIERNRSENDCYAKLLLHRSYGILYQMNRFQAMKTQSSLFSSCRRSRILTQIYNVSRSGNTPLNASPNNNTRSAYCVSLSCARDAVRDLIKVKITHCWSVLKRLSDVRNFFSACIFIFFALLSLLHFLLNWKW